MAGVEEKMNRFGETGILEWIEYLKLENPRGDHIPWGCVKNMIRNMLVRGTPELLKSSVVAVLSRPRTSLPESNLEMIVSSRNNRDGNRGQVVVMLEPSEASWGLLQ